MSSNYAVSDIANITTNLVLAPLPFPYDGYLQFQRAVGIFRTKLSPEQQVDYDATIAGTAVLRTVDATKAVSDMIAGMVGAKKKSLEWGQRLMPMLQSLQKLTSVIDTFTQSGSPSPPAMIWGVLKFLLVVCTEH